ncbi:DNA polymerase epsilon subunit 4 isoform X1 [Diorhabda carinulata]|uniref:DNA polymerase epsilon subunit 4 isoform X1 n=1 Tax=Diorhabda carinulata TaxID=1163345 RepID=UPI0025A243C2|nr:DNA polymerase epsilon subunit 4 isoform X1 [Diorhabda carinulata]
MDLNEIDSTESAYLDVEITENQTEDSDTPQTDNVTSTTDNTVQRTRMLRLPLARIKNIMKLDPSSSIISQDAIFLVTKATEVFLEYMTKEAMKQLISGKRKTLLKRDVDNVVDNNPNLCFLDGALE